jgi:hypothetical protein
MRARASSCFGQAMRLLVRRHLQAVLEAAQVLVGRGEIRYRRARQKLRAVKLRQGGAERRRLQAPIASAADELKACTMNSISRMPPGPSLTSSASSRLSTSRSIKLFISRRLSKTP